MLRLTIWIIVIVVVIIVIGEAQLIFHDVGIIAQIEIRRADALLIYPYLVDSV